MVILKFGKGNGQSVRIGEPVAVVDEMQSVEEVERPATESEKAAAAAVAERGEGYDLQAGAVELVDDSQTTVVDDAAGDSAELETSAEVDPTDIEADEQEAVTEAIPAGAAEVLQPTYHQQLEWAKDEFTEISLEAASVEAQLKILKADMKAALKRLRNLIDKGSCEAALSSNAAKKRLDQEPWDSQETNQTTTQSDSDAWRFAPISDLDLGESLTNKLLENGIETLGELEDLRAKIADRKAEWPKGIGEAKITKIEDAVITWLENNQPMEVPEVTEVVERVEENAEESEPATS
jgi:hypothetical protein